MPLTLELIAVLAVGGDALLHLRRAEAGVLPDHGHHRNVDLRKDVGRHRADRGDAEKQDQRGQHIERVRKSQREPNDAHASIPQRLSCAEAGGCDPNAPTNSIGHACPAAPACSSPAIRRGFRPSQEPAWCRRVRAARCWCCSSLPRPGRPERHRYRPGRREVRPAPGAIGLVPVICATAAVERPKDRATAVTTMICGDLIGVSPFMMCVSLSETCGHPLHRMCAGKFVAIRYLGIEPRMTCLALLRLA